MNHLTESNTENNHHSGPPDNKKESKSNQSLSVKLGLSVILLILAIFLIQTFLLSNSVRESDYSANQKKDAEKPASAYSTGDNANIGLTQSADSSDTLSPGKLTLAVQEDLKPIMNIDEAGTFSGILYEKISKAAEAMYLEVVINNMESGTIINAVQSHSCDAGIVCRTSDDNTSEDAGQESDSVLYTDQILSVPYIVVVPLDSPISDTKDLSENHAIGCCNSNIEYMHCMNIFNEKQIIPYPIEDMCIEALLAGKIDALVMTDTNLLESVTEEKDLRPLNTPLLTEEYYMVIPADHSGLRDTIDNILAKTKE